MKWRNGMKTGWTRRELFGAASLTAAGLAAWKGPSASELGSNGRESAAAQRAPGKHEPLENFKYDIEASEGWSGEAGSAKEANASEFPVSKSMAGVSMRLKPGGLRELHWHAVAAEWAFVIEGNVRATVIAPNGQAESSDFAPGDVWYFPKGHGHALQSLGPGDAHFVLVFDSGNFSEFGTFSITDWVGHTPPGVVARNLSLPEQVATALPKQELYITPGKVPPPTPERFRNGDPQENQFPHKFRLGATKPIIFPGGQQRIVSSVEFPIQKTVTGAVQELRPGALRELHWHPNADEWQFYISGRSRVTIFGAHGPVATEEFKPGQVAFIQQGFGHFVEQVGDETTKILIVFNSPVYEEISISAWLAANPPSMIADNFKLTQEQVARLPKGALGILG